MRRTLILQQRNDYTDSKNVITTVPKIFDYFICRLKVNSNKIMFNLMKESFNVFDIFKLYKTLDKINSKMI